MINAGAKKSVQRIKLGLTRSLLHYSFILVLLFIPLMDFLYYLRNQRFSFSSNWYLFVVVLVAIVLFVKWRELFYYQVDVERTDEEFNDAVIATANKLNWNVKELDSHRVKAVGYNMWRSRDSQIVTIKRKTDKVLINSMIEPGFLSVPDFFGANNLNRSTFFRYYLMSNTVADLNEKVELERKAEEERIENEPEWNLKNTLKRLIGYLVSFVFFAIGIGTWIYDGFDIIILAFLAIGSYYIYLDLRVLIKKRKQKSKR